ncbi:hypothetical protein EDF70_103433 [Neorhizobium sp. JUb45]|nr:hypothetical protein EDF70_103433 [Neorhizobium sp. JUb45]
MNFPFNIHVVLLAKAGPRLLVRSRTTDRR